MKFLEDEWYLGLLLRVEHRYQDSMMLYYFAPLGGAHLMQLKRQMQLSNFQASENELESSVCGRRARQLFSPPFTLAPRSPSSCRRSTTTALYPFQTIIMHMSRKCEGLHLVYSFMSTLMCSITCSTVIVFLTPSLASGLLPECSLHGPNGCRSSYELPVLWYNLRHRHRWADYYWSYITAGKGMGVIL